MSQARPLVQIQATVQGSSEPENDIFHFELDTDSECKKINGWSYFILTHLTFFKMFSGRDSFSLEEATEFKPNASDDCTSGYWSAVLVWDQQLEEECQILEQIIIVVEVSAIKYFLNTLHGLMALVTVPVIVACFYIDL